MPIKQPGGKLGSHVPLKTVRKRVAGLGRKTLYASLLLTSMIDMMAMLVIFLLANFSASGEILFMTKDIKLPKAASGETLERAPIIAITSRTLAVEGTEVGDSREIMEEQDLRIPALTDKLSDMREIYEQTHRGADERFKGMVIIQADSEIGFKLIRKVMYATVEAGYTDFNFAVLKKKSLTASAEGGSEPAAE